MLRTVSLKLDDIKLSWEEAISTKLLTFVRI